MIFTTYILFLIYWSIEGYTTGISMLYKEKYLKHKLKIRYVIRTLFTFLIFGLLNFYTSNFKLSTVIILSFLLSVPLFYYGFKNYILKKRWYHSLFKNSKLYKIDIYSRSVSFIIANVMIIYFTIHCCM